MTKMERIMAERTATHRARADRLWAGLKDDLDCLGVRHALFGSFAAGVFMAHSDIDLMILDDLDTERMSKVERAVSRASSTHGVKVDLLFAQYLGKENVDALLGS